MSFIESVKKALRENELLQEKYSSTREELEEEIDEMKDRVNSLQDELSDAEDELFLLERKLENLPPEDDGNHEMYESLVDEHRRMTQYLESLEAQS